MEPQNEHDTRAAKDLADRMITMLNGTDMRIAGAALGQTFTEWLMGFPANAREEAAQGFMAYALQCCAKFEAEKPVMN